MKNENEYKRKNENEYKSSTVYIIYKSIYNCFSRNTDAASHLKIAQTC